MKHSILLLAVLALAGCGGGDPREDEQRDAASHCFYIAPPGPAVVSPGDRDTFVGPIQCVSSEYPGAVPNPFGG